MNIGQAANSSGVSAKMIRYYESIDLMQTAGRTGSGHRIYSEDDVHVLRFIRQGRTLGFSIEHIRRLLGLWQNQHRTSAEVKAVAVEHIDELNHKIAELAEMRDTLVELAQRCSGDDRPCRPILEGMSHVDAGKLPHQDQAGRVAAPGSHPQNR